MQIKSSKILIKLAITTALALGLCACTQQTEKPTDIANALPPPNKLQAAQLNVQLGLGYLQQKQTDIAKRKLLKALKLAPRLAKAHYAMGYYYAEVGEFAAAKQEYQKAIQLNPNDPQALNSYGVFLCNQHEYKNGIDYFLKAIRIANNTQVGLTYENAGICALKIPNQTQAKEFLQKAITQNPSLVAAYYHLATIAYDQKDYHLAQQYLAQFDVHNKPTKKSLELGIKLAKHFGDKAKAASLELILQGVGPN